jgi:flagellar motor protein MotB
MVRKHTISPNTEIITGYNQFAYEPTSRFVKVTPSGIARADFYLALLKKPEPPMPDTVSLDQSITKVGNIEVQRITEPKNVVFIEDERSAPIKLPGFTFEVAKAKLRVEAYLILTLLADIMKEDPDQPLIVVGHTDSVRINTKEFKNNTELSIARANAVRNYLVEKMGIDPKRITARGYGETRPVASNKTTEGRAMNRRVEFFFAESIELPKRDSMAIVFKIPVKYEGAVNVSKLEINDILDTALHFNDGYGVLGDTTIPAKVEGNHINWTIDSIGRYFNKTLVYKVYVKHPSERILRLPSFSTSFKYYIGDSVVSASDTLRTLNQVAVAIRGRAVNFILSGVVFDVAKATLRTTALTALEVVGEMLKQDTTTTAIIEGHTDSSPIHTNEFPSNVQLSQARAKTVKERLTKAFGINPNRMRIVGFGPYRPVATNRTSEGRQANRRVEVRIFREEFVERVIPEGFVDSSSIAGARFYSEVGKDLVDTLSYGCIGDEFLFKLEVRRPVSNKTIQMVLIDSLPAGFTYVPNSLRLIRGIDSISHSSIIYAHCSLNDSVASLSFLVQINGTVSPEELIHHKFYIQRKEHTGQIITDEVRPLIIQVRNKRF